MSDNMRETALEEYEKLIQSSSHFEASIIEIQEMMRRNNDTLSYRKYIISKAIIAAKKLNVDITIFLIASEVILNSGDY